MRDLTETDLSCLDVDEEEKITLGGKRQEQTEEDQEYLVTVTERMLSDVTRAQRSFDELEAHLHYVSSLVLLNIGQIHQMAQSTGKSSLNELFDEYAPRSFNDMDPASLEKIGAEIKTSRCHIPEKPAVVSETKPDQVKKTETEAADVQAVEMNNDKMFPANKKLKKIRKFFERLASFVRRAGPRSDDHTQYPETCLKMRIVSLLGCGGRASE